MHLFIAAQVLFYHAVWTALSMAAQACFFPAAWTHVFHEQANFALGTESYSSIVHCYCSSMRMDHGFVLTSAWIKSRVARCSKRTHSSKVVLRRYEKIMVLRRDRWMLCGSFACTKRWNTLSSKRAIHKMQRMLRPPKTGLSLKLEHKFQNVFAKNMEHLHITSDVNIISTLF